MDNFKRIAIDKGTYDIIVEMARKNRRTISGQLRLIVETWDKLMKDGSAEYYRIREEKPEIINT